MWVLSRKLRVHFMMISGKNNTNRSPHVRREAISNKESTSTRANLTVVPIQSGLKWGATYAGKIHVSNDEDYLCMEKLVLDDDEELEWVLEQGPKSWEELFRLDGGRAMDYCEREIDYQCLCGHPKCKSRYSCLSRYLTDERLEAYDEWVSGIDPWKDPFWTPAAVERNIPEPSGRRERWSSDLPVYPWQTLPPLYSDSESIEDEAPSGDDRCDDFFADGPFVDTPTQVDVDLSRVASGAGECGHFPHCGNYWDCLYKFLEEHSKWDEDQEPYIRAFHDRCPGIAERGMNGCPTPSGTQVQMNASGEVKPGLVGGIVNAIKSALPTPGVSVGVEKETITDLKELLASLKVTTDPLKMDEEQFASIQGLLNKGIDININTGLNKVFDSLPDTKDWQAWGGPHLDKVVSLFALTDDLAGVVKAILMLVGLSMLKDKTESTVLRTLMTFGQVGVVYHVFKLPSLQLAFDDLIGSLTSMVMGRSAAPTLLLGNQVQALAVSDVLAGISGCIFAYLTGKSVGVSGDIDSFLSKTDSIRKKMQGAEFCLKTVSDFIVGCLEYIMGSEDSGIASRIMDGDMTLRKIREEIDLAFAVMAGDGISGEAMKRMSDVAKELKDYHHLLLKPNCKVANKSDIIRVIEALLKQVTPLAAMYDSSGLSNADVAFKPVSVALFGASRIGKSRLMPQIIDSQLAYMYKDNVEMLRRIQKNKENYVKWLKIDAKYLNLSSCPVVLAMDDYKIGRVAVGQELHESESLIFQLHSNRTAEVDGAFVKETKVHAKLVVYGTNVMGPTLINQLKTQYNVPDAPLNRAREAAWLVWVTDEFSVKGEDGELLPRRYRGLDKTKITTDHDPTFKHLRVSKFDPETEICSGPDFTVKEFLKELHKQYDRHVEEHSDLSKKYFDAFTDEIREYFPDYVPDEYVPPDERAELLRKKYRLTVDASKSVFERFQAWFKTVKEYFFGTGSITELTVHQGTTGVPLTYDPMSKYVKLGGKMYPSTSYALFEAYFQQIEVKSWWQTCKDILVQSVKSIGCAIYGYRYQIVGALGLLAAWKCGLSLYDYLFTTGVVVQSGTVVSNVSAKAVRAKMRAIGKTVAEQAAAKAVAMRLATYTQGSTMDNTTIDVIKSCLSNCAQMVLIGDTHTVDLAYCVQSGRLLFVPRHYADRIASFFELNPAGFCELRYSNGRSLRLTASDMDLTKTVCGTTNDSEDDIMSFYIRDVTKSDLRGRFMTRKEFERCAAAPFDVVYGSSKHDGKNMTFNQLIVCRAAVGFNRVCDENDEHGNTNPEPQYRASRAVVTSKVVGAFGECGSMYATSSKILGIHVSGNNVSSICLHFSQDDYDAHVKVHQEEYGHKLIYEKPPNMLPVSEVEIDGTRTQCVVGTVAARLPAIRARTMATAMYADVMESDIKPKYEYEPMSVSIKDTQKAMLGRPLAKPAVNKERLEAVIAHRHRQMSKFANIAANDVLVRVLPIKEVVDGNEHLPAMSRSTSMGIMGCMSHEWFGLPKGITKSTYLGETGKCESSAFYGDIESRVARVLSSFKMGHINYEDRELFVMAMPKDEHRKVGKNTRCVYAYSVVLNIIILMYMGEALYFYKLLGFATNIIYANPFEDGPKLYSHLTSVEQKSPVKVATDLDFSQWDILLNSTFYRAALEMVMYSATKYTDEDRRVLECLYQIIVAPYVLFPESFTSAYVVKFEAGLASGSPVTSVGNGAANDLLINYSVTCLGKSHLTPLDINDTKKIDMLAICVHGDDCGAVPSDSLIDEGFCYTSLAQASIDLGMKPQPISKDGVIKEFKVLVDDPGVVYTGGKVPAELVSDEPVEFLCRTFYNSPSGIVLANKHETNAKQLLYESQQFRDMSHEDKNARWNQFFVEVSMRGRAYYERFRRVLVPHLLKQGLFPECGNNYDVCKLHTARVVEDLAWV